MVCINLIKREFIRPLEQRTIFDASVSSLDVNVAEETVATAFITEYLSNPSKDVDQAHLLYLAAGGLQHDDFLDWNDDGILDHIALHSNQQNDQQWLSISFGKSDQCFVLQSQIEVSHSHGFSAVTLADLDADNMAEIIVMGNEFGAGDQMRIYSVTITDDAVTLQDDTENTLYQTLTGLFNQQFYFSQDMGETLISFADIDRDDHLDLLISGSDWGHRLYMDVVQSGYETDILLYFQGAVLDSYDHLGLKSWSYNADILLWQQDGHIMGWQWQGGGYRSSENQNFFEDAIVEESSVKKSNEETTQEVLTEQVTNIPPIFEATLSNSYLHNLLDQNDFIGQFNAFDDQVISYSLSDSENFSINQQGNLFIQPNNVQAGNSYSLGIIATDSEGLSSIFEISVEVVGENAVAKFSQYAKSYYSLLEGETQNFATITGSDTDGDALFFSLEGADSAFFSINQQGDIAFRNGVNYEQPEDADQDNMYIVTVVLNDGKQNSYHDVEVEILDRPPIIPEVIIDDPNGDGITRNVEMQINVPHYDHLWQIIDDNQVSIERSGNGMYLLAEGVHRDIEIKSIDRYGEQYNAVLFEQLTVDLTRPVMPNIDQDVFYVHQPIVLSGFAEKNSQVSLEFMQQSVQVSASDNHWQSVFLSLPVGEYGLAVTVTDLAGNVSPILHKNISVIEAETVISVIEDEGEKMVNFQFFKNELSPFYGYWHFQSVKSEGLWGFDQIEFINMTMNTEIGSESYIWQTNFGIDENWLNLYMYRLWQGYAKDFFVQKNLDTIIGGISHAKK